MNVEDQCVRGSTDDLGANRGHWGLIHKFGSKQWFKCHTCFSFYFPAITLLLLFTGKLREMKNFMTLMSFAEINVG